MLARRALEERGYTVLVASNAAEAMEIAAARRVDVLLTDIVMPHTSGPQLVSQYPTTHPAPLVIYMSGYADDALARYELDPRIVFLRKPFTPSVLLRTLRDALTAAAVALLLIAGAGRSTRAQAPVLIQGIADGEFWSTNATSNLLTRNEGRPAGLGRLQLWGAFEPVRRIVLYAQGEIETGSAADAGSEVYTNQFGIRYVRSAAFTIDASRLTPDHRHLFESPFLDRAIR